MAFYVFILLLFFFFFAFVMVCKVFLFTVFGVEPLETTSKIEMMWERRLFLQKLPRLRFFRSTKDLQFNWIVFRENSLITVIVNKNLSKLSSRQKEELLLSLENETPHFFKMRLFWSFWLLNYFLNFITKFKKGERMSLLNKLVYFLFFPIMTIVGFVLELLYEPAFAKKNDEDFFKPDYLLLLK